MKRVFNLIIVDESGSMSVIRRQALSGLNETINTVKKTQELYKDMEQRVSLLTFDNFHQTFIFDNVPAQQVRELTAKDYNPGGSTPLYDAIGLGISRVNALAGADDNVLVTIITDGYENASREYTLQMVKTLVEKLKKQNWTFALIGTDNLDVEGMAMKFSIDNHLAFAETDEGTKEMFVKERRSRLKMNSCLARNIKMSKGSYFNNDDDEKE